MDDLIGFIIFGIIFAISGFAKLLEKRKQEEQRRQRTTRQDVDELPEATRRTAVFVKQADDRVAGHPVRRGGCCAEEPVDGVPLVGVETIRLRGQRPA